MVWRELQQQEARLPIFHLPVKLCRDVRSTFVTTTGLEALEGCTVCIITFLRPRRSCTIKTSITREQPPEVLHPPLLVFLI